MSTTKAIVVIVTQAYLDHPDEVGTYFRVGDRIHIDALHRSYHVVRNGQPYGGVGAGGVPLEHGNCDPEWVASSLAYGGFIYEDEPLPEVPTSGIYFSPTGRRHGELLLRRKSEVREHGVVELSIGGVFRKLRMSPETARAMAHDLYRMARQLEKDEAE